MPGSKSYTNRALVMAALADGVSILTGTSESDDSIAMIDALKTLGIDIIQEKDRIIIVGCGGKLKPYSGTINVGAAGTSMRFLISLASMIDGEIILDGSARMRERPIFELVNALRDMGIKIEYTGREGCPPVKIYGGKINVDETNPSTVSMRGEFSSQYFTSLLLVGAILPSGIKINVVGDQISKSYIDMTIDGLKVFGIEVINDNYKSYQIKKGNKYRARAYHIEGDCSGAAYLWGIAALNGGKIKVTNINPASVQGDVKFPELLKKMGCKIKTDEKHNSITVTGPEKLKSFVSPVDMELMPDTAQPLAVLAGFTDSETLIKGLSTLRIKETDRIQAIYNELKKCGIQSEIGSDWIKIKGGSFKGAEVDTYKDHRMAMSFAMAGTKLKGMVINEPSVVSKSFPEFWGILDNLGIKSEKI
jgi:3-phosphoshikimate 1-carboxyvinyltransferase